MVSKNQIKFITSLQQKKYRNELGLFFAEGNKIIFELINAGLKAKEIFSISPEDYFYYKVPVTQITASELKKISALVTPNESLGIFHIPTPKNYQEEGLIVALEAIRDPGNLGTIIRLCDWFGINQLICSFDTVDIYNPKVVQASMGSLARVQVYYLDLEKLLLNTNLPVFGTFMDGQNVYESILPSEAILLMGNEANGISNKLETVLKTKISIPRFGDIQKTESLNVASATAILLSEFRRSINGK